MVSGSVCSNPGFLRARVSGTRPKRRLGPESQALPLPADSSTLISALAEGPRSVRFRNDVDDEGFAIEDDSDGLCENAFASSLNGVIMLPLRTIDSLCGEPWYHGAL